jgi:hypothetical protein
MSGRPVLGHTASHDSRHWSIQQPAACREWRTRNRVRWGWRRPDSSGRASNTATGSYLRIPQRNALD